MDSKFQILKVILINMSAWGITLTQLETGLKITSMIVAIVYTLWRFYRDIKNKNGKRKGNK